MSRGKTDALAAVQSADQVRYLLEPIVCDTCEEVCWSVEGKATGQIGDGHWETTLLFVDHRPLSAALLTMSRSVSTIGGRARIAEDRQYLMEHHPRLW